MTILENLIKISDQISKNKNITITSSLKEIGIDSLDLLDMIVELEGIYNIEIDDSVLLKLETVKDVIDAIEHKIT
ncbi:MAG: acyl carrier protein [Mycoplasmataceae bacterium]|nr:acyl carrier protein [Mycoplasmataceae bacterium]